MSHFFGNPEGEALPHLITPVDYLHVIGSGLYEAELPAQNPNEFHGNNEALVDRSVPPELALVPVNAYNAHLLIDMVHDPRNQQHFSAPRHGIDLINDRMFDSAQNLIDTLRSERIMRLTQRWLIAVDVHEETDGSPVVGMIASRASNDEVDRPRGFELSWCLDVDRQGRGYATRAAKLLVWHLMSDTSTARITARIHEENERSSSVAKRVGMTRTRAVSNGIARYNLSRGSYLSQQARATGRDV